VAYGEALKPEFAEYSKAVIANSRALAAALAAKGYRIISGGTDNHLMLVDLFGSKNITGKEAEKALEKVGISINKNMIPFDPRKPLDPSGIRLGTPALTTRGCGEGDMRTVADLMDEALAHREDEVALGAIRKKVREFSLRFPVPGIE
jgi:glycine hydroxymethyltransferase